MPREMGEVENGVARSKSIGECHIRTPPHRDRPITLLAPLQRRQAGGSNRVDDYEAIRQVFAAYAHAMDNGRAAELAELFEPDGVFELLGDLIEGRIAIAAMVDRFRDAGAIGEGK